MHYLNDGETLRGRFDECLHIARYSNDPATKESYLREAAVLMQWIEVDLLEARHSAELALPALYGEAAAVSYFYDDEDIRAAWDGTDAFAHVDVFIARLKTVVEARLREANGLPPFSHTPDRIVELMVDPRFTDSADIPGAGEGLTPTPRLPAEQFPTSDEEPEVDFDVELTVTEPDVVTVEVTADLDRFAADIEGGDDEDFVDPDPVPEQAPKAKLSGFEELKKTTTKKKGKKP